MAAQKPEIKSVARSRIIVAEDLLPRVAQDDETARRYLELLREGHKFPPLDVFQIDTHLTASQLHLVDGTYRLWALDMERLGQKNPPSKFKVQVAIHIGTRCDAIWFAMGANQRHGLPLTETQRMRAVTILLADPAAARKSDRAIAKQCGASPTTVGSYRKDSQEGLPFAQEAGVHIGQGVPPVTERDEPGGTCESLAHMQEEALGSAGVDGASLQDTPGALPADSGSGAPEDESPPAPAEWPESIKDVILDATEALKHVASVCTLLRHNILAVQEVRRPGTCMFHAPAALERLRRLRLAVTRAIPYCVCPDCKGSGKRCPRCQNRGWLVRAETDEDQPTPNQIAQFEARGIDMPGEKAEAARQLDDIFAAETWQERQKHQAQLEPDDSIVGEDSKTWK